MRVTVGVIGCSQVAERGMLPALRGSALVESVMIGSRDPGKAKKIAEKFGARAWGTYEDVLKDKNVQAVYVSVPNTLHEEWSVKAIEAGKHVICEKPAAISYDSAKRMVVAAKKGNVRLLEGLMFHYHPQHEKVKEFITHGVIGKPLRFDGCFGIPSAGSGVNLLNKDLGGGSFNYQMPYPLYASRMIFGEEPERVVCRMKFDGQSGVDTEAHLMLQYPQGKIAFASTLFSSYFVSSYSVLGSLAQVRMGRAYAIPRDRATTIFLDRDDKIQEIRVEPADQFRLMLDDFLREIGEGRKTKDYEGDLLAEARVLEAARVSAREERMIRITDIT